MLSFLQGSRNRSVPVYLYEVVYGSARESVLRLTDAEQPVVLPEHTYTPVQIKHGEIHASGTLDKTTLEVSTRFDSPLANLFRHYPPSQVVTLTVLRGEADDPGQEFSVIWAGRILSCSIEFYEAKLTCEPIGTAVRRPGLRRNYQVGCPHVLYGPSCGANQADFTRTVAVSNVEGSTARLEAGWNGPWPVHRFVNGIAEWTDGKGDVITRTILQVASDGAADFILLAGTTQGLRAGGTLALSLGCNHQMSDCQNFSNLPNYGGCPWVPTKNPVGSYNPFY